MKKLITTIFVLFISTLGFAQTDTIYFFNKKLSCSVKEITPDAVKYSLTGEELLNSVYKNSVQKIKFKNGRVQTFSESTSFKKVESIEDFENVTITQVEGEVKGLYKIGELSSKARGTTTLSNQERVKQRAVRKLKIQAAMMGANIIYMTNQQTEGNVYGGYYQAGRPTNTNTSGIAYTNQLPDFDNFKKLVGDKRRFMTFTESRLWSSSSDVVHEVVNKQFVVNNIINENGIIMLEGKLDKVSRHKKFRVVSYTDRHFNIFYKDKKTAYNIKIVLN